MAGIGFELRHLLRQRVQVGGGERASGQLPGQRQQPGFRQPAWAPGGAAFKCAAGFQQHGQADAYRPVAARFAG